LRPFRLLVNAETLANPRPSVLQAWNGFKAINATCRTGSGFAEINDVNAPNGGGFLNGQDSYFFAETLKYRYERMVKTQWEIMANKTLQLPDTRT